MLPPINHSFLVPTDGNFQLSSFASSPPKIESNSFYKNIYKKNRNTLYQEQQKLYADNKYSILFIFQAMDAAGKDSTIRHVFSGVNPSGFQVSSFKKPSTKELDHDFLWRTTIALPERGRIGVFNRSYYEEVLVVKVHNQYLQNQQLPDLALSETGPNTDFWAQRYHSINEHERHLASNGTIIRKFFLNVSREEQHRRFKKRLTNPDKFWKFSAADLKESEHWDDYMSAYSDCLQQTSTAWAPWYCIPADNKPAMRAMVSDIVLNTFRQLQLEYPQLTNDEVDKLPTYLDQLLV